MDILDSTLQKFLHNEEVIVGKSYNTVKSYRRDLIQFNDYIKEYEEIKDYKKVEIMTIRSYIAYLNKGDEDSNIDKISKRSINRKLSALRTYFKYLISNKIIENNPIQYINTPKFDKTMPTVLNKDDIDKLRSVIDVSTILGIRDRLIIELLYSSGLRASELISLSELMIDFNENEIRVIGKGNKERITFFSETSKEWLKRYINAKKGNLDNYTNKYIFVNNRGEQLTDRSLRRLISKYGKLANINKEITPHIFRHSFATTLLNNGVDIRYLQELLGHSSITSTQIYTHISKNKLKEVYLKTHPLAKESN